MLTTRKHKQGFSLLEVTVALAIIGLCLTAILKVFTSSTRSVGLTSDYYKAMQIAESQMAMLLARSELVGSSDGTVDDYYEWQAEVSEYEGGFNEPLLENSPLTDYPQRLKAYHFDVQVTWGGNAERVYRLSTVRLGR